MWPRLGSSQVCDSDTPPVVSEDGMSPEGHQGFCTLSPATRSVGRRWHPASQCDGAGSISEVLADCSAGRVCAHRRPWPLSSGPVGHSVCWSEAAAGATHDSILECPLPPLTSEAGRPRRTIPAGRLETSGITHLLREAVLVLCVARQPATSVKVAKSFGCYCLQELGESQGGMCAHF